MQHHANNHEHSVSTYISVCNPPRLIPTVNLLIFFDLCWPNLAFWHCVYCNHVKICTLFASYHGVSYCTLYICLFPYCIASNFPWDKSFILNSYHPFPEPCPTMTQASASVQEDFRLNTQFCMNVLVSMKTAETRHCYFCQVSLTRSRMENVSSWSFKCSWERFERTRGKKLHTHSHTYIHTHAFK